MSDKVSDDSLEQDELEDADEVESEVETEEDDEDRPRRRRRARKRKHRSAKPGWTFDPVADLQRRGPHVFARERFQAWVKQHHPEIRDLTGLTVEILAEYDDYDLATVRQRASRPSEPSDPKVAEFAKDAFNYAAEGWPEEFRSWAARQHRIHHSHQVTRAIMDEWWKYAIARLQAHHAKADFDEKE